MRPRRKVQGSSRRKGCKEVKEAPEVRAASGRGQLSRDREDLHEVHHPPRQVHQLLHHLHRLPFRARLRPRRSVGVVIVRLLHEFPAPENFFPGLSPDRTCELPSEHTGTISVLVLPHESREVEITRSRTRLPIIIQLEELRISALPYAPPVPER